MKRNPSAGVIAGIAAGVLVYALAGYFLVISPQRSKSAELKKQIQTTQQQIEQYRLLAQQTQTTPPIRIAELFRLTKAMPDEIDMPGVVLELSRVARDSGIEFKSITPQGTAAASGYSNMPITLVFDGNYYELSDFLFRLRSLVRVHSGRLYAQGRLFVVDSISFNESEHAFPRINATLTVHAFVFGDAAAATPGAVPAEPPATPAPGTTDTTQTTTTAPTTTESTSTQQSPDQPPETPPGGASATGSGE